MSLHHALSPSGIASTVIRRGRNFGRRRAGKAHRHTVAGVSCQGRGMVSAEISWAQHDVQADVLDLFVESCFN
jgi:hypothetical protein